MAGRDRGRILRLQLEPDLAPAATARGAERRHRDGLILYDFQLDKPASFGPQVTSDDVAHELDWYMDWSVNDNVTLNFVAAFAEPGRAVEQSSDRTDTFYYGMIFAAYSF